MVQQQTISYVKGINCIYLPVSNIQESAKWYVENLHLELLKEVHEHSTQAQLKISSEQTIFLIKVANIFNLTYFEVDGNEQCVLTLEVSNIQQLHEKLRSNSIEIDDIEDNDGCGLSFKIKDPDGNMIDIWGGWA
ncbi:VOC family protein [Lederbergia wuyishanensis]|uniref:Catechol 2,3-dioxygenase-like lactoylglutathione lyase family enzyme n=1 Tax=Lederbergia wuyishanensis TaxID=1347903 RepID=A0ABU0D2Y2_9BACI|nr:VOC family protein [Lederbergia wuyishanensis]MCJ8007096.1 VOC family protein [Lederbergia wuyishanensis]MDQ0342759.1 catechol 2,3-dioxygenase-like lactoylglutathione lyase family enzyme [Lederbergia wuyishanensis]